MPNALRNLIMDRKGKFICLEGLDGCGKTTQAKLLVSRLENTYDAIYTAEPSGGRIGQFIKGYCLDAGQRGLIIVEALLFAADRLEHVNREILPAMNAGRLVVSDRYVYSSFAYQGAAGLGLEWIERVNEHAICPDLALFIDVQPETVVQRLKPRKSVMENLETQRKVREVYLKFVDKGKLVRIDGNASKEKVANELLTKVLSFLEKSC